jgi:outer membrane protein OmpA-like peptidoglycan-associated protein
VVIGHTDRVGNEQANDELSLQRAERVKAEFVAQGIAPAERIRAAGRGERELLVPTENDVDEPLNRRVEINVR